MNNFKSGSGNLDFGGDESDEKPGKDEEELNVESVAEEGADQRDQESPVIADTPSIEQERPPTNSRDSTTEDSDASGGQQPEYPYFIRRNNVGDERDKRLELHVRQKVANQEAEFRNELAAQLGTGDISKTDAREFALLAAFEHPERVAELMQEEGFGALE
ncbi:acyl-CoA dehydrogenase [Haloarchaeobius sp. FL176]|uniref:acyl-CoA dehydrogenase n=1 Tax=Haloarchaeobius sp. FL176 TaxID=2967129 RepID=UPI002147A631|nr:acyl-CoA dehydrogenase [Haloarchaeobius sp. FL176]